VRGSVAALVVVAVVAGCASRHIVLNGIVNEDAVAKIRSGLPAVRGLSFTAPVPVEAVTRDEIKGIVAQEIDVSYPAGDIERVDQVYIRLGLLPAGTALRPALQRLYEQEGAGFYDPRTKRLVLSKTALATGGFKVGMVGWLTGRDIVGEFLLAHELTHALQDQHYTLPTAPEPITDSHGDRELARHALLEGDATLAGFAYFFGRPLDAKTIGLVERQLHGVPDELAKKYPDAPELLRASLAFQYDQGTTFVGRALASGGCAAVDKVHLDPPASSEQVLHPERYYDVRDRPVTIALAGDEPLEKAGWTRCLEDTLGEFQIRVLAGRFLPAERAARVADGWGGDRVRALCRGDDLAIVWMTAWDSPGDATDFAQAMPEIVRDARVQQHDDRVLVLIGPAALDATAAGIWSRTTMRRG